MFDLDAGLTIRRHPHTGMRVAMVKTEPGKFFFENGTPVDENIAEQAGFDVAFYRKQRERKSLIDAATAKISERFDTVVGAVIAQTQSGQYQARHAGGGIYHIINADGEQVTPKPFGEAEAVALIQSVSNAADPFVDLRVKEEEAAGKPEASPQPPPQPQSPPRLRAAPKAE